MRCWVPERTIKYLGNAFIDLPGPHPMWFFIVGLVKDNVFYKKNNVFQIVKDDGPQEKVTGGNVRCLPRPKNMSPLDGLFWHSNAFMTC